MLWGMCACLPCGVLAFGLAGCASPRGPAPPLSRWGEGTATTLAGVVERDVTAGMLPGAVVSAGDAQGVRFSLAYIYRDSYYPRSTDSMGSSLADFSGEQGYLVREYRKAQSAVGEVWFPINEKTSGRVRLEYDLEQNEVARQVYEIIRDLHCWMGSLAFSEDNGDYRVMLMLYLKAYPNVKVDVGI